MKFDPSIPFNGEFDIWTFSCFKFMKSVERTICYIILIEKVIQQISLSEVRIDHFKNNNELVINLLTNTIDNEDVPNYLGVDYIEITFKYYNELILMSDYLKSKNVNQETFNQLLKHAANIWNDELIMYQESIKNKWILYDEMIQVYKEFDQSKYYDYKKRISRYIDDFISNIREVNVTASEFIESSIYPVFGEIGIAMAQCIYFSEEYEKTLKDDLRMIDNFHETSRDGLLLEIKELLKDSHKNPNYQLCAKIYNCLMLREEYDLQKDEVNCKSKAFYRLYYRYRKIRSQFDTKIPKK